MTEHSRGNDSDLLSSEILELCKKRGLDTEMISVHLARVLAHIRTEEQSGRGFCIEDTCRIDNGGVIAASSEVASLAADCGVDDRRTFVAFTPAAGAASRYLEPLKGISNLIKGESFDLQAVKDFSKGLPAASADWPLPPELKQIVTGSIGDTVTRNDVDRVVEMVSWPKALYPCSSLGKSYLDVKRLENLALYAAGIPVCGEVYVAPEGRSGLFLGSSSRGDSSELPLVVLEQSGALNTLRFMGDGTPVTKKDGELSIVAAGHGALIHLFGDVKRQFPDSDYLLIRNIDNVVGTSAMVVNAANQFCRTASAVISAVESIRSGLDEVHENSSGVGTCSPLGRALKFLESLGSPGHAQVLGYCAPQHGGKGPGPDPIEDNSLFARLTRVLGNVFHANEAMDAIRLGSVPLGKDSLRRLFSRPVNVMGQVPNSGKDVGGTPVFAVRPDGKREKLCIEVAHVPQDAIDSILKQPEKATHFNPVFVAAELRNLDLYNQENPYWSCVRKQHDGIDVWYQESFLYEILGSSSLANVMFLEIPRILFNPHKTLVDAASSQVSI